MKKTVFCFGGPKDGQKVTFMLSANSPLPATLVLTKKAQKKSFVYHLTFNTKEQKYFYEYVMTKKL